MAEAVEEGFGGEMACDFTGGCASYAVANDEGSVFGKRGAGILIGVAHQAAMGEHGEDAREVNRGIRRKGGEELRLVRLYSRSVCHFGTRDARVRGSLETILLAAIQSMVSMAGVSFGIVWRTLG